MNEATQNKSSFKRFLPLIIFALLVALFAIGLTLNPRLVPSPLIGKAVPEFELPLLNQSGTFSHNDLKGKVTLVNVWASWCYACRQEHEVVTHLSKSGIRVIGLNYKDKTEDAKQWLQRFGNPYEIVMEDKSGRISIDWGVYGAPETFVVDANGIIREKKVGPLTVEYVEEILMPLINTLENES